LLFEEPNRDFLAVDLGGEVRADEVVVDPEENEGDTDQGENRNGEAAGKLFAD
jgi:hypothetical protein